MLILFLFALYVFAVKIKNQDFVLLRGRICDILGSDRHFNEVSNRWVKTAIFWVIRQIVVSIA
jgi:hypothetical protein